MKINIELPNDEFTKAVYEAIKKLGIGEIIAKKMIDETAKTSKEGYLVDAIKVIGTPKKDTETGSFVWSLLEDFGYNIKENKKFTIRSLYEIPLRVVDVTKKVEDEGEYYLSKGGLRVLEYKYIGLSKEPSTTRESEAYKGMKEILEKGEIEVRYVDVCK